MILAGNESLTYSSGQLGSAKSLEPASDVEGGSLGSGVACSSSHFCMLVYGSMFFTWNGQAWSAQHGLPGGGATGPDGLACPVDGFCLAIGEDGESGPGSVLTYKNGAWTSAPLNTDGQLLIELTCASQDYCHILGNDGDVFTFNSSTWTPPVRVTVSDDQGSGDIIGNIACAAGPLCLSATGLAGVVLIDHGMGFARLRGVSPILRVGSGSCGSSTFCLIETLGPMGGTGYHDFDGTKFVPTSQPPSIQFSPVFSCTRDGFCLGSEANGNAGTDIVVTYQRS
jgi:hypothetical protein